MTVDDASRIAMDENRTWWDAATEVNFRSKMYDVPGFLAGRNGLDKFIIDEAGDVRGKKLLHLQCHFGIDTMNWARLGADVTGVDYSPIAIATARRLAQEARIKATFVESNLYDLDGRFDGQFDVVFSSWGVLVWLPDLASWGCLIADVLRPGGFFYLAESHPMVDMLEYDREVRTTSDLTPKYSYFPDKQGIRYEPPPGGEPHYADEDSRSVLPTNEWSHPLSQVFGGLTDAGLVIEMFHERPALAWRYMKGMVQGPDGLWRMPDGVIQYPLSYSLRVRKPHGPIK